MATAVEFTERELKDGNLVGWKQQACVERCSRCGGLMVTEHHVDLPAQRCVQCGEFIDPVILLNRRRTLPMGRE